MKQPAYRKPVAVYFLLFALVYLSLSVIYWYCATTPGMAGHDWFAKMTVSNSSVFLLAGLIYEVIVIRRNGLYFPEFLAFCIFFLLGSVLFVLAFLDGQTLLHRLWSTVFDFFQHFGKR